MINSLPGEFACQAQPPCKFHSKVDCTSSSTEESGDVPWILRRILSPFVATIIGDDPHE